MASGGDGDSVTVRLRDIPGTSTANVNVRPTLSGGNTNNSNPNNNDMNNSGTRPSTSGSSTSSTTTGTRHHNRIVQDLLQRGRSAVNNAASRSSTTGSAGPESDDDSVFDVVHETFRSFRRPMRDRGERAQRSAKRGRKFHVEWKKVTFLLRRSNPDYFPRPTECSYLQRHGFGKPEGDVEPFNCNWSMELLKTRISELYPGKTLGVIGFRFARCDKGKKVHYIDASTVREVKMAVGKGMLLLIPTTDIELPAGAVPPEQIRSNRSQAGQEGNPDVRGGNHNPAIGGGNLVVRDGNLVVQGGNGAVREGDQTVREGNQPAAQSGTPTVVFQPQLVDAPVATATERPATVEANLDMPAFDLTFDFDEDSSDQIPDTPAIANEVTQAFGNLHMSLNGSQEREVTVRRSSIVEDVLALYEDPGLCKMKIKVQFEGEEGEDLGGLSKEMMTAFWNDVTKDYFKGEHVTVPFMPLHRRRKEGSKFVAIGRVLTHAAAVTETLPSRIAQTAIICIVFGDTSPDCSLDDFLLYVSPSEKYLLRKALRNFSALTKSEMDMLTTFFCVNGLTELPKAEELSDQIRAIAQSVLVDTPMPLYQLMRQGIPQDHLESFWCQLSIQHLTHVMLAQRPTVAKVLSVLKAPEDLRPEEEKVLYYLQDFIRSLDADDLLNFLLFVTASIHMPSCLSVSFVGTFGLQRRPVAHTCSNLLEISTNYFSAQEFKREMRMFLGDTESYRYSFM